MHGLETIALAVAALERAESAEEQTAGSSPVLSHLRTAAYEEEEGHVRVSPDRSAFPQGPRIVSQEFRDHGFRVSNHALRPTHLDLQPSIYKPPAYAFHQPPFEAAEEPKDKISPLEVAQEAIDSLIQALGLEVLGDADPGKRVASEEVVTNASPNDVLMGRGGETNHHSGNVQYRQFVKICQPAYIAAKRREKPLIAERIVTAIRTIGGRFLKKNAETGHWSDVGNVKAREKTSQALREGAPDLRNPLMLDQECSLSAVVAGNKTTKTKKRRFSDVPILPRSDDSPRTYVTAVTNDDEESESSIRSDTAVRGPRIKWLKRRHEGTDL